VINSNFGSVIYLSSFPRYGQL